MPVERVLLLGPRLVAGAWRAANASALRNARSAADALNRVVADRRLLAPLEPADEEGPGALVALSRETCMELLASRSVGRLAYIAREGVPDIVPVNVSVHDGDLLIRSGPGPKLQAAERGEVVAFEVDDLDEDAHVGWSVVVVGRATRLDATQLAALPPGVLPETWARGPRHTVVRIRPSRVHGRRLS